METILLIANDRIVAGEAITVICNDIKAREDANHKLYFRRIMMGAYTISSGHTEEDGTRILDGNRELVIFPVYREEQLEKLKTGKNLIEMHNATWILGEGPKKVDIRTKLIDWLLGAEWDS